MAGMVKRFRQEWTPERDARARSLGMTPRQIVIIASLIETEAKLKDERPMIASVIYNRLNKGVALGVDSTIIYASKLAGKWRADGKVYLSDVNRRSRYNTRFYSGLPPGPVGNPGESSSGNVARAHAFRAESARRIGGHGMLRKHRKRFLGLEFAQRFAEISSADY